MRHKTSNQRHAAKRSFPWRALGVSVVLPILTLLFYDSLNLVRVFDIPTGILILAELLPVLLIFVIWLHARKSGRDDILADEEELPW